MVVAHEAVRFGGIGAEIAAQIAEEAFDDLDAPPQRIGAPFTPVPFSPPLEDGDAAHAREQHGDEERGYQGGELPALEDGQGDDRHADPEDDLAEVVGMPRPGPQACGDEPVPVFR